MLWLFLLSCSTPPAGVDNSQQEVDPPEDWAVKVSPELLDFGALVVGSSATQLLKLENTGEADLLMLDLAAPPLSGLEVSSTSGALVVQSGATAELLVSWQPETVGELQANLSLDLGATSTDFNTLEVPVTGQGQGSILTLSTDGHDFGGVNVGCESRLVFTVSNSGTEPLDVEGIELDGDKPFELVLNEEAGEFPWTLAPFSSQEVVVNFHPDDRSSSATVLTVDGGDTVLQAVLSGEGEVDDEETLTWTAGEENKVIMLFHINEVVLDGYAAYYTEDYEGSLEYFFQTLEDNRVTYRAGFYWNSTGVMSGSDDYIDNTWTVDDAVETAIAMTEPGANAGDNDRTYTTLFTAYTNYDDWINEEGWENAKINLIAVNRDTEQSGGSWSNYVSQAQAWRDEDDKVLFHAIGGPPPSGCDGYVEYFSGWWEAVNATGGAFISMCGDDWELKMQELAGATMDGSESYFPLTGQPLESSIKVYIDGLNEEDGWAYDSDINAVIFAQGKYPAKGSEVKIYYQRSTGCD